MKFKPDIFMLEAISMAKKSFDEGGIPIGSVLVKGNEIVSKGHNRRVQHNNHILHGEMDCLFNAGRIRSFKNFVMYSTLMPCYMCAGTIIQFKIPKVIVGESENFSGAKELMESHGVELIDLDLDECKDLLRRFIEKHPDIWYEDIGEN